MDPLSIATGVITSLQVASSILSFCYDVRAGMKKIPWTMIQVIEEVRDLRNLIEGISSIFDREDVLDEMDAGQLEISQRLSETTRPAITTCLAELRALESRIKPEDVEAILGSKRKAFLRSFQWRLKDDEAKDAVASLQRCKATLNVAISSNNSLMIRNTERLSISINAKVDTSAQRLAVLDSNFRTSQLDHQQKAVVQWLSPLKPAQTHATTRTVHQAGTSEWLLGNDEFTEWLNDARGILWVSGPPGSGKTMTMSYAIESISQTYARPDNQTVFAFAYCDFRDPHSQTIDNILGTFLSQLCMQLNYFSQELIQAYEASQGQKQGLRPPLNMLSTMIRDISAKRQLYLFVDAMDEADDCRSLATHLLQLIDSTCMIKILATSRNDIGIQRAFEQCRRISLEDHVSEIDRDIHKHLADRLSRDSDLAWLSQDLQNLISEGLLFKSNGMYDTYSSTLEDYNQMHLFTDKVVRFRWATCQLDAISHCRTVRNIKRSLDQLPAGLNETYGRILAGIAPSDIPLVQKTLAWLSFAATPLTLLQLWEALAIEKDRDCIDDECRLRSPQDILGLGHSLVTVTSSGYVMLAHLSVRDYLLSQDIKQDAETSRFFLQPEKCQLEIAQDCLTYLYFTELSFGPSTSEEEYLIRLKRLPLLEYASRYWFYHVRAAEDNRKLRERATEFFFPERRNYFMSWVQIINADSPFKWNIYPRHATSLYYAASLGLDEAVGALLASSLYGDINAPGSRFGGTALHAATLRDHFCIMERLIAKGAAIERADWNQVSPLHSAASRGSLGAIRILLKHGAPTSAKDGLADKTPAAWARLSGHSAAADLIEHGIDRFDAISGSQSNPGDQRTGMITSNINSKQIEVWKPSYGFFPDYYEKRSGLDSSIVISTTVGLETSYLDAADPRNS